MRAQILGIGISLAVHGMAAMVIFGISQPLIPATRTIRIDFNLDSSGRGGKDGSRGSDEQKAPLAGVSELSPAVSEKRSPVVAKPNPSEKQAPSVAVKAPPTNNLPHKHATTAVRKPSALKRVRTKPALSKKTTKPDRKKMVAPELPVQAVKAGSSPNQKDDRCAPLSASTKSVSEFNSDSGKKGLIIGNDGLAESRTVHTDGSQEGFYEDSGYDRTGTSTQGDKNTGTPQGDEGSTYLSAHFNFIRGRLKECLYYPSIARKRGWSGKVMVAFTIYPDGRADNIEIQESCGNSLLDKSALKTVRNACPFPKPPMTARIVIPILYQLN